MTHRTRLFTALAVLLFPLENALSQEFSRFFLDRTMRVDYHHFGTKDKEQVTLDKVFTEGLWSGSTVNLVDTLNLGEFLFRVFDLKTGLLLYSRGFSSMFNEWQTTDEANRGVWKTMHETVRFPFPKERVQLTISRRDKFLVHKEFFSTTIDPNDPTVVNTEKRNPEFELKPLMVNGNVHSKVDILIVGDGYAKGDIDKFKEDAAHFNDVMFGTTPFKERKNDFNVRALCVVSPESGIDIPDRNVWKRTALETMYNTFGSARYVLTESNKELRDIAGQAPYDFLCILLNDSRYGGGGIYQQYTTTYTVEKTKGQEWQRDYVYVHEFGHCFAGLGDEYYASSTGYNEFYPEGVEPWEPNVTRLMDTREMKWESFLSNDLTLPTDWGKQRYDSLGMTLSKLNRLADDYYEKREPIREQQKSILANPAFSGKVGAFEGAGYVSTGMYRPSVDCRMFSLSLADFDPVCKAAIIRQIDFYSR